MTTYVRIDVRGANQDDELWLASWIEEQVRLMHRVGAFTPHPDDTGRDMDWSKVNLEFSTFQGEEK